MVDSLSGWCRNTCANGETGSLSNPVQWNLRNPARFEGIAPSLGQGRRSRRMGEPPTVSKPIHDCIHSDNIDRLSVP
ncbi:hypothetical protein DNFV4_00853 [Nitrospira tepida]|uniref:Uncharacterized protein n=1 Tax=Nitrospira tepida TaxID=2973512 RepID=A0AA86T277_9BACT|nr:hypothetical protein DNFV4_00853 [Nitrospira tepida]